jgi:BirA family biotin operon repressor/biotin-[acetyl-CoA-carboxylase] ligase
MTGPLDPEDILAGLTPAVIPSEVTCFARLPSTMDEARRRAADGAAEGLVVLAEEQTAGRGRLGRAWLAPPGSALLLSLLLRPRWLAPERAFALTMLAATGLCAAVEEATGLRPALKWPNDVLLNGRRSTGERRTVGESVSPTKEESHLSQPSKAAGILAELHLQAGAIEWAVIGVGVNVHAHPPLGDTSYPATSLDAALGRRADRLALLRALLRRLDAGYAALRAGGYEALFADWRAHLDTLGRAVRIVTLTEALEGVAEDVSPTGALLVREADGALHTVTTGDVQA